MQIPPQQLEKFKLICKEHLDLNLTDEETKEEAIKVLMLMKAIYKPIPKNQSECK